MVFFESDGWGSATHINRNFCSRVGGNQTTKTISKSWSRKFTTLIVKNVKTRFFTDSRDSGDKFLGKIASGKMF